MDLSNDNTEVIIERMSKLELVSFIEVNKGNSDILVSVIYKKR